MSGRPEFWGCGHGKWGVLHVDDEPLLDPDCRDGKHQSCIGPPCECPCHADCGACGETL
jgi:hypothetical protein